MLATKELLIATPFELWREDGVLRLVFTSKANIDLAQMKEVMRLMSALDPKARTPILLETGRAVNVTDRAKTLLTRSSSAQCRRVGYLAHGPADRQQGEVFKHLYRPHIPFKVFHKPADALNWLMRPASEGVLLN